MFFKSKVLKVDQEQLEFILESLFHSEEQKSMKDQKGGLGLVFQNAHQQRYLLVQEVEFLAFVLLLGLDHLLHLHQKFLVHQMVVQQGIDVVELLALGDEVVVGEDGSLLHDVIAFGIPHRVHHLEILVDVHQLRVSRLEDCLQLSLEHFNFGEVWVDFGDQSGFFADDFLEELVAEQKQCEGAFAGALISHHDDLLLLPVDEFGLHDCLGDLVQDEGSNEVELF